jgi:SsrA-binding protein
MLTASTHVKPDAVRRKKLLLHAREISRLIGAVERKGYTLIPLAMYWVRGRAKLKIGLAKGKKLHDKRASAKEKDWQRDKQRIMKHG